MCVHAREYTCVCVCVCGTQTEEARQKEADSARCRLCDGRASDEYVISKRVISFGFGLSRTKGKVLRTAW